MPIDSGEMTLPADHLESPPVPAPDAATDTPDRALMDSPPSPWRALWLTLRVMKEFAGGLRALRDVGPCVTIFGSARFGEGHPAYDIARTVAREISTLGFTVMTGGGPGLMEAANRGAREAGGRSIGCNIRLPQEQMSNRFVDRSIMFRYFFVRKVMLFKYSYAFVALPGGLGTMDELFEALTLIQTKKVRNLPVVLLGTAYWRPLVRMLDNMVEHGAMDLADLRLLLVTDDVREAVAHVEEHAVRAFGLRRGGRAKSWALKACGVQRPGDTLPTHPR